MAFCCDLPTILLPMAQKQALRQKIISISDIYSIVKVALLIKRPANYIFIIF